MQDVPLQQHSQSCSFIIVFLSLITIQVIERIAVPTPQHTNTSVCVSVQIHHLLLERNHLLEIGVNGVEYNTS